MREFYEPFLFITICLIILLIGVLMYLHYKRIASNFDKSETKLKLNYLKLYKQYSILFIVFSLACTLIALLKILL